MKQSLAEAIKEAEKYSNRFVDDAYVVMDKPYGKAVMHSYAFLNSSPIFLMDLYKKGYYPYCKFINGKRYPA